VTQPDTEPERIHKTHQTLINRRHQLSLQTTMSASSSSSILCRQETATVLIKSFVFARWQHYYWLKCKISDHFYFWSCVFFSLNFIAAIKKNYRTLAR